MPTSCDSTSVSTGIGDWTNGQQPDSHIFPRAGSVIHDTSLNLLHPLAWDLQYWRERKRKNSALTGRAWLSLSGQQSWLGLCCVPWVCTPHHYSPVLGLRTGKECTKTSGVPLFTASTEATSITPDKYKSTPTQKSSPWEQWISKTSSTDR